jgi:hypothetical protein
VDRVLVLAASVAVALLVGFGVASEASDRAPARAAPRGETRAAAPGAATPSTSAKDLLDWSVLASYQYKPGMEGLPEAVKALEGKRVTMRGFLMPLSEYDDIHEFDLVASHMTCCFGVPAGLEGMVLVRIASARGLPNTNEPIEVTGTFHARETTEQGYVLSIFEIDEATGRVVGY